MDDFRKSSKTNFLPNIRYKSKKRRDSSNDFEINNIIDNQVRTFSKEQEQQVPINYFKGIDNQQIIKNAKVMNEPDNNDKNELLLGENYQRKPSLIKGNSQILYDKNCFEEVMPNLKKEEDLSRFVGKIKISGFYSSSEMVLLIENIIKELNMKKKYSFQIKDSVMQFIFLNAQEALSIFKQINIEKLYNKYYKNLQVDIQFDIKQINRERRLSERNLMKRLLPKKLKILEPQSKMEQFKSMKKSNYSKDNVTTPYNMKDKNYEGIYNDYLEYFKKRKEERRLRELNYSNGKDISMLASTPYVERKRFQNQLREYKNGKNISPIKFYGYIDKATANQKEKYEKQYLYEVPDFQKHWNLREDNKKKWISPLKFGL